ncbi:MAG: ATP-dependent DNA helicase RecG [Ignavibacteriae bacterium]|nr:ATP-dependent DNA helicase RecG [Ignavibacteriota bacterium]
MSSVALTSPNILSQPIQFLKGIGERRADVLKKFGVQTVHDLFFYVPRRYLDRTSIVTIEQLRQTYFRSPDQTMNEAADVQKDFTVVGDVRSFRVMGMGKKSRFVLILGDDTGTMQCIWFGGVQYWKTKFQIGETLAVSGQPSAFGGVLQFVHPSVDRIAERNAEIEVQEETPQVDWTKTLNTGGLVPLYPSSKELERVGLDSGGFRRVIGNAIQKLLPRVDESLPPYLLSRQKIIALRDALQRVHFPKGMDELGESLRRLKYDEFFYFQIKLALRRNGIKTEMNGISFKVQSKLARQLVDSLSFKLTQAQIRVIKDITEDMSSSKPMNRLLQGDVGSGKTIVALTSMLIAVENGYQAVFMAPTEILAEQHSKTLASLLKGIDVNVRLLVGAQRTKLRRDILDDVQRGSAQIVVGTHALFEKGVEFANLGYVVIDEQHRFGVLQRQSLQKKGANPDVLVMTATPIPRTLSLTLYGDLDVSIINELPKDRKPIKTVLRYEEEKASVFTFVRDEINKGRQAYFVYPLVEESEKLDLKAATVHYEQLQSAVFPDLKLGLLHGRLSSEEKDEVMQRFKNKEIHILVATTVIEVGIDVPNASIMVIENAERFGLSQLHQLRGRVGRGSEQSFCILLSKKWIAAKANRLSADPVKMHEAIDEQRLAERRLATMVQTNDGFKIAEVDLQLRGPGDFFGTRQSGLPEFRVADILTDTVLLDEARRDAFELVEKDPHLKLPEHHVVAEHLRSLHRDAFALMKIA